MTDEHDDDNGILKMRVKLILLRAGYGRSRLRGIRRSKRGRSASVPDDRIGRRWRGARGSENVYPVPDAADGAGPADPTRLDRRGPLGHRSPAYSRRHPGQGSERI